MLFLLVSGGGCCKLAIVTVSKEAANVAGAIMTDRNAAKDLVKFAPSPDGLQALDASRVYATYWPDPDPIQNDRNINAKFAELLVPDGIPVPLLKGVTVACKHGAERLKELGVDPKLVRISYGAFFSKGCTNGS